MQPREIRKQRRQQRRRDELVEAAIAIIDRHGTADFTIANVADEAGVTKPSVYYYFADKNDVLRAVTVSIITAYAQGAVEALHGRAGADAAEAFVRYTVSFYDGRFARFRAVYLWPQIRDFVDEDLIHQINTVMNEVFDAFEEALAQHAPPSVVPRRLAFAVWNAAFGLLSTLSLFDGAGVSSRHLTKDQIDETCRVVRIAATVGDGNEGQTGQLRS